MPLSEQEQRLLEEMERGLYQNDADFVATVSQRRGKPNYTVVVIGALLGVLGIATLLVGVVVQLLIVGVLGFVIMFAGVLLAIAPPRRLENLGKGHVPRSGSATSGPASGRSGSQGKKAKSGSFMDGLNDRWDKRQDERGQ